MLAAATGARNGELCGLEWADLDLDAGTVRFRQALTIVDPAVLPDAAPGDSDGDAGSGVGAAQGARRRAAQVRCQQRHPHPATVRRAGTPPVTAASRPGCAWPSGQPPTVALRWVEPGRPPHPVQLDLVFRTERGTPVNPNHASRAFARLAASVGLAAHPHLLRHALASAMAANKEPASIIAAQLRHADGGALAQRVYIHQLPQTAPRLAELIEGRVRPSGAERASGVGGASGGGKPEGNRSVEPGLTGRLSGRVSAAQRWCGRDRIRTCVGNAGDFTDRSLWPLGHPAGPRADDTGPQWDPTTVAWSGFQLEPDHVAGPVRLGGGGPVEGQGVEQLQAAPGDRGGSGTVAVER